MVNNVLQIRVDEDMKKKANIVLDNMGLDMSTAIRMFLQKIIKTNSIPFDIKSDNKKMLIKVKKTYTIEDFEKYMDKDSKLYDDIDEYIKESRRDRF